MPPLLFAALLAAPLAWLHGRVVRHLPLRQRRWLGALWATKLVLALCMGHYDIYRFIVFLQRALAVPGADPWVYAQQHPEADFPYPPLLFYLHAAALWPWRAWLNAQAPYAPVAYAYSLIRLPTLLFDLAFLRWLLARPWYSTDCLRLYAGSAVLLFHQYYSGQFDLLAAYPLAVALDGWPAPHRPASWRRWVQTTGWLGLSLALKPFALLFFPLLWLLRLRQQALPCALAMCGAILFFKLSEWPYLHSPAYLAQMGAGARALWAPSDFLPLTFSAFLPAYGALGLWALALGWQRPARPPDGALVALCTLTLGALAPHSAGWMTWVLVGTLISIGNSRLPPPGGALGALWNLSFVLRWSFVPNSPLCDSLGTLLHCFLGKRAGLPMGLPRAWLDAALPTLAAPLSQGLFYSFNGLCVLWALAWIRRLHRDRKAAAS